MSIAERGWQITHPLPEDDHSVLALMRAFDTAVSGEPDTDLDDVHHVWSLIDIHQDAWLVRSTQDELLAYAAVFPHKTHGLRIDIYTTPDLIESDLPGEMLAFCLDRADQVEKSRAAGVIQQMVVYILHTNLHYRTIFEKVGFKVVRHIYQMRYEMSTPPEAPEWPQGIQVRAFVPDQDDRMTYQVVQDAFERPTRSHYSFEMWKQHMLRPGSYRPELWKLAFSGDELVGVCLGFDYPDEGWIRQLGVIETWHGRGLGSALLRDAFVTFYADGKRKVGLTTESDNPDAIEFYRRVGMSVRRQYDEYVRLIPPDEREP
ncbi:MAG: GNAT family N-acetyltransferase [Anaerolineales bacterium]|jgi:ribosomal protein S18 acetylase RimI-like enzyme